MREKDHERETFHEQRRQLFDLPANIAYKQERLRALYGRVPERVTLVKVDFDTDDLRRSGCASARARV
jgi:hypothetical protein